MFLTSIYSAEHVGNESSATKPEIDIKIFQKAGDISNYSILIGKDLRP